jgi:hypothetical protein
MKPVTSLMHVILLLCCASGTATAAPVDVMPSTRGNTPTQRCETAVTAAIQKSRGANAKQVQFVTAKRAAHPASAASEPAERSVQGEGRYQGAGGNMPFTYSCTLDAQSHDVSGVIFKDTGTPARHAEKPWQADLAHLSPEACEAGAATAVNAQYPRAVHVLLSSRSRQLTAAPNTHTYLHGQGSMERAPGMPTSAFTYRCELETATGKLLGVQLDLVE